jgi:hypothetical protein
MSPAANGSNGCIVPLVELLLRFRKRDFAGAADAILRWRKLDDGFGLNSLYDLYATRMPHAPRDRELPLTRR